MCLCLKICEIMFIEFPPAYGKTFKEIFNMEDNAIRKFPLVFNEARHISKIYSVTEAYTLPKKGI